MNGNGHARCLPVIAVAFFLEKFCSSIGIEHEQEIQILQILCFSQDQPSQLSTSSKNYKNSEKKIEREMINIYTIKKQCLKKYKKLAILQLVPWRQANHEHMV